MPALASSPVARSDMPSTEVVALGTSWIWSARAAIGLVPASAAVPSASSGARSVTTSPTWMWSSRDASAPLPESADVLVANGSSSDRAYTATTARTADVYMVRS